MNWRKKGNSRSFTIKLNLKKWRDKDGEDHELRMKKDENRNRMESQEE